MEVQYYDSRYTGNRIDEAIAKNPWVINSRVYFYSFKLNIKIKSAIANKGNQIKTNRVQKKMPK